MNQALQVSIDFGLQFLLFSEFGTDYQGASAYSTNSTGKLSFLDNILLIFKGGADESGNYGLEQWLWK